MIILPMAGLSQRFFRAGYSVPKYQLKIAGTPVFDYVLQSFKSRFDHEKFLIILKDVYQTQEFVRQRLKQNGLDAEIVTLTHSTQGQAETVSIGLNKANINSLEELTIFNIDSFRPGFSMSADEYKADGFIETFLGHGDAWSFVAPKTNDLHSGLAEYVTEKERVSELCCTGLYYFRSREIFETAYALEKENPSQNLPEHYIAPIYNQMIRRGGRVLYRTIPNQDVIFCGVPKEYEDILSNPNILNRFKVY